MLVCGVKKPELLFNVSLTYATAEFDEGSDTVSDSGACPHAFAGTHTASTPCEECKRATAAAVDSAAGVIPRDLHIWILQEYYAAVNDGLSIGSKAARDIVAQSWTCATCSESNSNLRMECSKCSTLQPLPDGV